MDKQPDPPAARQLRHVNLIRGEQDVAGALDDAADYLAYRGYPVQPRGDPDAPLFVVYHPGAIGNPFQTALYASLPENGALALPAARLTDIAAVRHPANTVCHLHWLDNMLGGSPTEQAALERLEDLRRQFDRLRDAGMRLIWTVHNVLPHDVRFPSVECELRQAIIDRADAVHIMTPRTFSAVGDAYDLARARTFLCPHPSYAGLYPDFVSRDTARYALGLRPDTRVFLFFGLLREYKGLLHLLEAFRHLRHEVPDDVELVIAGVPKDRPLVDELKQRLERSDEVSLFPRRIPVEEVQYFFRAADYAAYPYTGVLNSGSAILAHTFGVPIVGPHTGGLADMIESGGGIGYDQADPDGLRQALRRATATAPETFHPAIDETVAAIRPEDVSRRFIHALRDRLGQ